MSQPSVAFRLYFDAAIDPRSGKPERAIGVTERRALEIEKRGPLAVVEMYEFVGRTVGRPVHVYRGIRSKDDDWTCYVSTHAQRYVGKMLPSLPEDPEDLFLVFVNAEGVAYSWRWEKPDPADPNRPKDAKTRFGEEVI